MTLNAVFEAPHQLQSQPSTAPTHASDDLPPVPAQAPGNGYEVPIRLNPEYTASTLQLQQSQEVVAIQQVRNHVYTEPIPRAGAPGTPLPGPELDPDGYVAMAMAAPGAGSPVYVNGAVNGGIHGTPGERSGLQQLLSRKRSVYSGFGGAGNDADVDAGAAPGAGAEAPCASVGDDAPPGSRGGSEA